ncbi:MAG: hypothetical protein CL431_09290 [Acidimicrobiaceae bacterium]|jgi:acyl-CoA synthetase (NDP forming)|nr:hypothetical protein [Acidimicrobiaceae bacterium]|tara:strand:+ start:41640 stop:42272 length:633 start_codon:yes stop_codon:yes gene_type:complete
MRSLSEFESKQLLETYGLVASKESIVSDIDEALDVAEKIGYPVVLKISGENTEHKSELGGVKLGLQNQSDLSIAFEELQESNSQFFEFLVSEYIVGKREFIAGYLIDKDFGPTVMFGLGGIFAEAITDVTFRILPCDREELTAMIHQLKSSKLLEAFRGEPEIDIEALVDVLESIATCGLSNPDVIAIDVNPIIIKNDFPIAVDALVIRS